MKTTKIMLAVIATFLITWLAIATIAYLLASATDFRDCATNGGTLMFMLIFGWIPAVIVGCDLSEKYEYED
jgi:hypothetical protein